MCLQRAWAGGARESSWDPPHGQFSLQGDMEGPPPATEGFIVPLLSRPQSIPVPVPGQRPAATRGSPVHTSAWTTMCARDTRSAATRGAAGSVWQCAQVRACSLPLPWCSLGSAHPW